MVSWRERRQTLRIEQPNLLLVEGRDDFWFFQQMLSKRGIEGIQVVEYGGKDGLGEFLVDPLVKGLISSSVVVRTIGVTRDADDSYGRAFQSVGDSLRRAGLPVPSAPLAYSNGTLDDSPIRVVAHIVPDNSSSGDLESLCLNAVADAAAMPCVVRYFQCLQSIDQVPRQESKARLGAFLSANLDNPNLLIGQAVAAGVIPWDSPAFDGIHKFLDLLASAD